MLRPFQDKTPRVHETAFVEESAHVIGDVELGAHSSVWFQCVIRADVNRIRIGHHTNIQDSTVIHVNRTDPVEIGDHVTLGHAVRLQVAPGNRARRLYERLGFRPVAGRVADAGDIAGDITGDITGDIAMEWLRRG